MIWPVHISRTYYIFRSKVGLTIGPWQLEIILPDLRIWGSALSAQQSVQYLTSQTHSPKRGYCKHTSISPFGLIHTVYGSDFLNYHYPTTLQLESIDRSLGLLHLPRILLSQFHHRPWVFPTLHLVGFNYWLNHRTRACETSRTNLQPVQLKNALALAKILNALAVGKSRNA